MRAVEYGQDHSPTNCRSLVERAGGLTRGLPQGFKPSGLSLQNKVQRNSWKLLLKFMAASSSSDLPLKVGDLQGSLLGVSPSLSIHLLHVTSPKPLTTWHWRASNPHIEPWLFLRPQRPPSSCPRNMGSAYLVDTSYPTDPYGRSYSPSPHIPCLTHLIGLHQCPLSASILQAGVV